MADSIFRPQEVKAGGLGGKTRLANRDAVSKHTHTHTKQTPKNKGRRRDEEELRTDNLVKIPF